jgi:hypothetical protein
MHYTCQIHAVASAGFTQQAHCPLFKHSCPDTAQYIFTGAALDDDVGDACVMQELAEQKAGRPGTDNCNLGTH